MKASLQLNEIEQLEFYSKSQMDKGQFIPKINTYVAGMSKEKTI